MKTPEDYFHEQVFDLSQARGEQELSDQEEKFIRKYLGALAEEIPEVQGEQAGPEQGFMGREKPPELVLDDETQKQKESREKDAQPPSISEELRQREEVQLVSFFLGGQEYSLPIDTVEEVIKYVDPTKLPVAPPYLEGVINLRGRVMPVVDLTGFLKVDKTLAQENRFMMVCKQEGFQVALLVESIATMYRIPNRDIEWNVESALGTDAGLIIALIKNRERIISILSIEGIVNQLLHESNFA